MKISNKLPHFSEPTLLVVSSPTGATFYVAEGDEVKRVADFKIEKPHYSDWEDFEGGQLEDKQKLIIERDFKQKFTHTVKELSKTLSIKKLYLFTTKSLNKLLIKLLPKNWRTMIAGHLKGDYTKDHLVRILEKIREQRPNGMVLNY